MSIKSFGKNTVIYLVGSIGLRFSSFLLLPLYTKYLSIEDFGLLQTLLLTIQIMITIIDVGVRSSIVRFLQEFKEINKIGLLLGSSLFVNIFSSVVLMLIATIFLVPFFDQIITSENSLYIILFTSFTAIFQTLSLNIISYYRAQNESLKFMLMSIGGAVLLIITTLFLLVYLGMGIEGVLLAQILTYSSIWAVASFFIFIKHGISISKSTVKKVLKFGFPLIFATSGDLITTTTAVYFLSYFHGLQEVAIYSLGFKLAQIAIMVLIGPFQMAYEPYVYSQKDNPRVKKIISQLTTYLVLSFSLISFLLVFFLKDLMIFLFDANYSSSYFIIFFILPGMGFIGIQYIAQSMLHLKNKTNVTGTTIAFVTLISVLFNYILILNLDITGLIISYNFAMGLTTFILFKYGLKVFPVKFEINRIILGIFIFVILLTTVGLLRNTPFYIYYSFPIIELIIICYFLFKSNFFSSSEKLIINNFIAKIDLFSIKNRLG
jgi:O-antigen/teichoic acid export membrane protein